MASVYKINKGVNKPIEFRGLKAQYIWYLAAGLVFMLVLFAVLYIIGISPFICIGIIGLLTALLFFKVYSTSRTYGEHGIMKKIARRSVPAVIRSCSRKTFIQLMKKA